MIGFAEGSNYSRPEAVPAGAWCGHGYGHPLIPTRLPLRIPTDSAHGQ